jgi:5'-nucleotidase
LLDLSMPSLYLKEMKPYILITNDDGVFASGIRHLWEAVKDFSEPVIIAPAMEQSSMGLSITLRDPLRTERVFVAPDAVAYSVNGTPADCVKLGCSALLKKVPDLVLSGINRGTNAGRNILYSGTVAGAIEAVMQSIPGIAFSTCTYKDPDYETVLPYIMPLIQHVLKHPLPKDTLLNVNFPNTKEGPIRGFKMTRHGRAFWGEQPVERKHPVEGHTYWWLGAQLKEFPEEDECDISWLDKGYITCVPIRIDSFTHEEYLKNSKKEFNNLYKDMF